MSSRLLPCSRAEFIRKLKRLGWDGPFIGSKHHFMARAGHSTIRIPNPHKGDISVDLLSHILNASGISRDVWMKA